MQEKDVPIHSIVANVENHTPVPAVRLCPTEIAVLLVKSRVTELQRPTIPCVLYIARSNVQTKYTDVPTPTLHNQIYLKTIKQILT